MNPEFMREALDLARKGRALASPNPMVGAVLVRDGEVVGRGFHTYAGPAARRDYRAGAGGRTRARRHSLRQPGTVLAPGPHAALHRRPDRAGVARVVAPIADPNPLVAGEGFPPLARGRYRSRDGAEFAAEAEKLNEPFLHFMRTGRPLVTLKTAITLDGKISAPDDNRGWITSTRARAHVQQLRHDHDAILTGIGTVLADDPCSPTAPVSALPPAAAHRDGFAIAPPARFQMVRGAQGDLIVVTTSASRRSAAERRWPIAASRCWCSTAPAAAPICAASSSGWAASNTSR
jgi:diaminohydroxyphosphoribosylaminopyrimidine deaminase / 5-amino-6-(5-phosphoribosylamino)uracil reductase